MHRKKCKSLYNDYHDKNVIKNRRTHPKAIKKYRALPRGIFQNYITEMRLHAYSDVEHAFLELQRMVNAVFRFPIFSRRGDKSARNEYG